VVALSERFLGKAETLTQSADVWPRHHETWRPQKSVIDSIFALPARDVLFGDSP